MSSPTHIIVAIDGPTVILHALASGAPGLRLKLSGTAPGQLRAGDALAVSEDGTSAVWTPRHPQVRNLALETTAMFPIIA